MRWIPFAMKARDDDDATLLHKKEQTVGKSLHACPPQSVLHNSENHWSIGQRFHRLVHGKCKP